MHVLFRIHPASVNISFFLVRMNSCVPSSSSNDLIILLRAGCVMNRFSAALVKLLVRVTSIKHFKCLISNLIKHLILFLKDNLVYLTFYFSNLTCDLSKYYLMSLPYAVFIEKQSVKNYSIK